MIQKVIAILRPVRSLGTMIRHRVVWDLRALVLLAALSGVVFSTPVSASLGPTNATDSGWRCTDALRHIGGVR